MLNISGKKRQKVVDLDQQRVSRRQSGEAELIQISNELIMRTIKKYGDATGRKLTPDEMRARLRGETKKRTERALSKFDSEATWRRAMAKLYSENPEELSLDITGTVRQDSRLGNIGEMQRVISAAIQRADEILSASKSVKDVVDEEVEKLLTGKSK